MDHECRQRKRLARGELELARGADGLRIDKLAGAPVEVLEDDLRVRVGDPAGAAELLGHVVGVVDLDDAVVGVEPLRALEVGQDVAGPADITAAGAGLVDAGGGAVAFVIGGDVVHRVQRAGGELPDAVGDLDGEAVVEVGGEDEDRFI